MNLETAIIIILAFLGIVLGSIAVVGSAIVISMLVAPKISLPPILWTILLILIGIVLIIRCLICEVKK